MIETREITIEPTTTPIPLGDATAFTGRRAPTVPAARFRAQERFWTEVRQRILARRPEAAHNPERLY